MRTESLRLSRVTIEREGIRYLDNLSFNLFQGEILGVLPLNNLGIELLMEVLYKNISIDYGFVYVNEKLTNNHLYSDNQKTGLEIIDANTRLIDDLNVLDNIYIMNDSFKNHLISADYYKKVELEFLALSEEIGVSIPPYELVGNLSCFQKSIVAVLKSVILKRQIILCKHVSDLFSANDLMRFHEIIRSYSKKGFSFIYIGNHHEEIFGICDRALLLKNGHISKVIEQKNMTHELMDCFVSYELSHAQETNMFGIVRESEELSKEKVLEVTKLSTRNITNLSFSIKKGECLTILDTDNIIFDELIEVLFNEKTRQKGISKKCKLAYIEENSTQKMLFPEMNYIDNLCFDIGNLHPQIWFDKRFKKSVISEFFAYLGEDIYSHEIQHLSKASLLNLVYFRTIIGKADVVVCKQPFSGSDMFLRNHTLSLIEEMLHRSISVVILAVNISDTLRVSDRLILVKDGKKADEYDSKDFNLISNAY